jgi:hypothetical protein
MPSRFSSFLCAIRPSAIAIKIPRPRPHRVTISRESENIEPVTELLRAAGGIMTQKEDHFRAMAAACLEIARQTADSAARTTLLLMAQRWFELAEGTFGDDRFNALIDDFNQRQMVAPLKS